MPLKNTRPVNHKSKGLSDSRDGTNSFAGAMTSLVNLIPAPDTDGLMVCRPAATQLTDFSGLDGNTKGVPNALLQIGNICYGMIPETSGANSGKDVPFAYNVATDTYLPVTIDGALPTSPSATGGWVPPTMEIINTRIIITHPGYPGGGGAYFGWLDISGFTSNTVTGTTHSNTTVDTLSTNVLAAGWQVGMTITGTDIPANTTIKSIAADGMSLVLSQAATGGHASITFTVAGGTASAPLYAAGNTNGNALAAVPVAVFQFNGRAWYAVGTGVTFSDAGFPCQVTNATQALNFQNGLQVTAFGGLPYTQTSGGGQLQALMCFQGDENIEQITGDVTTNNLSTNTVGIGVGTQAPNTICNTPLGLAFVSADGLRVIDFIGIVSPPYGSGGSGVLLPFLNAVNPSRMCAAYNADVIRISVQNAAVTGSPVQEYWYHISRKAWSGPHTFPAAIIVAYQGTPKHGFVEAPSGIASKLFNSVVTPTTSDTYVENGTALAFTWATVLLPDNEQMAENFVVESLLGLALPAGSNLGVIAANEAMVPLGTISIMGPAASPTIWGAFTWGAAPWSGPQSFYAQYDMPWPNGLVFKQMTLTITGFSALGLAIGNFYFRYKALGYRLQALAQVSGGAR